MSKSISQAVLDELGLNEITAFCLLEFTDGVSMFRYTDCDVPLWYAADGTTSVEFTPRGFSFNNINYSSGTIIDNATIKVDNVNQILTSSFTGGVIRDQEATIWVCVLNSDDSILGAAELFMGNIDGWDLEEDFVTISISNIFTKWHNAANNRYSASCRWKVFKGKECQYVGPKTDCKKSYDECVERENTANFGGFKWLPDLENKTSIWWGPTPKEQK